MKKVAIIIVLIGLLNFVVYVAIAAHMGGDAVDGREENGHYYLAEHGHTTEVSKEVFTYSLYHTYSLWITHPMALFAIILYGALKKDENEVREKRSAHRGHI